MSRKQNKYPIYILHHVLWSYRKQLLLQILLHSTVSRHHSWKSQKLGGHWWQSLSASGIIEVEGLMGRDYLTKATLFLHSSQFFLYLSPRKKDIRSTNSKGHLPQRPSITNFNARLASRMLEKSHYSIWMCMLVVRRYILKYVKGIWHTCTLNYLFSPIKKNIPAWYIEVGKYLISTIQSKSSSD